MTCPCGTGSCASCREVEWSRARQRLTFVASALTLAELRAVVALAEDFARKRAVRDPRTPGAGL